MAASPFELLTALQFLRMSGSAPPPALLPAPRASAAAPRSAPPSSRPRRPRTSAWGAFTRMRAPAAPAFLTHPAPTRPYPRAPRPSRCRHARDAPAEEDAAPVEAVDHAVAQPAALLPAVDAREAEEPAQPELAVEPPAEGAMEEDEALDAAIARAIAQPEALPAVDARAAEAPAQPGLAVDADAADDMLDAAIAGAIAQPEAARNVDARVMQVQAHRLAARVPCRHCGTLMWPSEGAACCAGGKHILGPAFNPPIDDEYLSMMRQPHFSHDSRLINSALALGSQCTAPSRAMGGLGFHEQHYAHLSLLGTTYLVLRNPHAGNNPFDNYLLPRDLLLETATHDLGAGYAERLLAARAYLHAHHPMACRLRPVADVPAERLDFSSVIRLEANSTHKGAMELAHVSSGVVPKEDSNRVLYFDLRKHEQGGLTSVSSFNALFEVLRSGVALEVVPHPFLRVAPSPDTLP